MDNNGDSETLTIDLSFFGLPKQVKEKMTIYLEGKKYPHAILFLPT